MRVLIVEDDNRLSDALAHILEENGYDVDAVRNGEEGFFYAKSMPYDVIILDVLLPERNGLSVTSDLRRAHVSTPILLLSARSTTSDKIRGYDAGADDYMTKPFSPAELMAHLRALTRRQGSVVFEHLSAGDLTLDLTSGDLSCGAKSIHLSYKEFAIMRVLMSNVDVVISKDTIIDRAWGSRSSAGDNNVEAYISFLRKKIAHVGSRARIDTLRKMGYRLVASYEEEAEGALSGADKEG